MHQLLISSNNKEAQPPTWWLCTVQQKAAQDLPKLHSLYSSDFSWYTVTMQEKAHLGHESSLCTHIYKNTRCCPQTSVEQARNQTSAAEIQYSTFKKCTLFPTQTQRGKLRDDKGLLEHQSCPQKKGHPAAQSVEPHISYFKSLLLCELLGLVRKLLGNINRGSGNTHFLKLL